MSKQFKNCRAFNPCSYAWNAGRVAAADVARDYDGQGLVSRGYQDQLGDAGRTQSDIEQAIRSLLPPTDKAEPIAPKTG